MWPNITNILYHPKVQKDDVQIWTVQKIAHELQEDPASWTGETETDWSYSCSACSARKAWFSAEDSTLTQALESRHAGLEESESYPMSGKM